MRTLGQSRRHGRAARKPLRSATRRTAGSLGDKAGEHLRMKRSRFSARPYVVVAFVLQVVFSAVFFALTVDVIARKIAHLRQYTLDMLAVVALGTGVVGGGLLAYYIFRDRWKCIEAFSSRFCLGVVNLSMIYVPAVALVYANMRGIQKLWGR